MELTHQQAENRLKDIRDEVERLAGKDTLTEQDETYRQQLVAEAEEVFAHKVALEREADRLGHAPPVIDATDVLTNPIQVLSGLCERLGIPWEPAMLFWEPGPRATDGPWAPHWYGAVEASTGFGPPETDPVDVPDEARRLAERCRPYYERLAGYRIAPERRSVA